MNASPTPLRHSGRFALLLLAPILSMLAGCATIFLGPTTEVEIITSPPRATVRVEGDSVSYRSPVVLTLPRSGNDLRLTISNDSLRREVALEPHLNNEFIFWNFPYYGFGHVVDLFSEKRYSYDDAIHIDLLDSARGYPAQREGDRNAGSFRIGATGAMTLFLPGIVTWYSIDTGGSTVDETSFFSLAGSLDYFYTSGSFLSIAGGAHASGGYSECMGLDCGPRMNGYYIALANGHYLRRWWLAYGVQGSRIATTFHPMIPDSAFTMTDVTFGPHVTLGLQLGSVVDVVGSYTWNLYSIERGFAIRRSYQGSIGLWFKSPGLMW